MFKGSTESSEQCKFFGVRENWQKDWVILPFLGLLLGYFVCYVVAGLLTIQHQPDTT